MKNNAKTVLSSGLLVFTALIWGVAFVAQSTGGDITGPYTFCFVRYLVAGAILFPLIKLLDRFKVTAGAPKTKAERKTLLTGGLCCGLCLSLGSILQQLGLYLGSTTGKAGFLTACYIVLVPVLGIFLKKRCGANVWLAVVITVCGLYLLCINGSFRLERADILLLLCSVVYACHILVIDFFLEKSAEPTRLSMLQFFFASAVSAFPMFVSDMKHSAAGVSAIIGAVFTKEALIPLMYAAVMSSAVGYTLQIVGQRNVPPAVASLLMSLESVFSALAGWVILHQVLGKRELLGCALIFLAVVLAQLPFKSKRDGRIESRA